MDHLNNPNQQQSGTDPKVVSIIAYLTFVGWIAALVLNNPRSELGSFHVRQALGIFLLVAACSLLMVIPILGWLAAVAGYLLSFIMWVVGFIGALQGEQKLAPVLGDKFQEWFKSL